MPIFDRPAKRFVARIVYDGPALAGKTTNLRRLHALFSARRRGDLLTPQETGGRTLFFDWLSFECGRLAGYALRSQILSVPGQDSLSRRRWALLERADVVVFVCESLAPSVVAARPIFEALWTGLSTRPEPPAFLLQANKQDLPGALAPEAVRELLGAPPELDVVAATAVAGSGVQETVSVAIHRAADIIRRRIAAIGLGGLEGTPEGPEELKAAVLAADRAERYDRQTALGALAALPPPLVDAWSGGEPSGADRLGEAAEAEAASSSGGAAPAASSAGAAETQAPAQCVDEPEPRFRPIPIPDLLWPDDLDAGRILADLGTHPVVRREDLVNQTGRHDGSGSSDSLFLEAGPWFAKSSDRRVFTDLERAREAFEHLVERKRSLGLWLALGTLVLVAEDGAERFRMWTVAPRSLSLGRAMSQAAESGNEARLASISAAFAIATVEAMRLAAREEVQLDIHPSNFGLLPQGLVYLDDHVGTGPRLPAVGYAILKRVEELAARPPVLEVFLGALEEQLHTRLTSEDAHRVGLLQSLVMTPARGEPALAARHRLERVIWRLGS